MKTRIFLICLALLGTASLRAMETESSGNPSDTRETRILQRLLQMESGELAQLRQTIERIEQMTPEEKERMRARIGQLEKMPPGQGRALRDFYRNLPEVERERMRQNWRRMPREERWEWHQKLRGMGHEDRVRIFKENDFLTVPRAAHKARKSAPQGNE